MGIERLGKFSPTPEEQEKIRKEIEVAARQKGRMPELIEDEARKKLGKANARLVDDTGKQAISRAKEDIEAALKADPGFADKVFEEEEGESRDI